VATQVIHIQNLTIDRERFLVTIAGRPVALTYLEFQALYIIGAANGKVVSYDQLAEALWNEATPRARRRLAVIVSRIRAKLGAAADYIDTVHRVGYRVAPAPQSHQHSA